MDLTDSDVGKLASLGAAVSWAFSVLLFRTYGHNLSATWLTFFKGAVAMLFLGATILLNPGDTTPTSLDVIILALSGIIGIIIGDSAFFIALPRIGGSLTSAIQCIAPPLTAVGAWVFLDQSLSFERSVGLTVTCVGVAGMVWFERKTGAENRNQKVFQWGVAAALVAATGQAAGVLLSRQPLEGLGVAEGSALRLWLPVVILGGWEWYRSRGPLTDFVKSVGSVPYVWQITLAAFLGTFIGLMLMVYGMTHAPVGIALAINSTYPLWIVVFEMIWWRRNIRPASFVSLLISVGGIFAMVL